MIWFQSFSDLSVPWFVSIRYKPLTKSLYFSILTYWHTVITWKSTVTRHYLEKETKNIWDKRNQTKKQIN